MELDSVPLHWGTAETGTFRFRWGGNDVKELAHDLCKAYARYQGKAWEGPTLVPVLTSPNGWKKERCVLGGTFDHLHLGHKVLLTIAAVCTSNTLYVGITTDAMLQNKAHAHLIQPFDERQQRVVSFVQLISPDLTLVCEPLHDAFGPSLREDVQRLFVTQETARGGIKVNEKRSQLQRTLLDIVCLPVLQLEGYQAKQSSSLIRQHLYLEKQWTHISWNKHPSSLPMFDWLEKKYSEHGRHYHTLSHVAYMLQQASVFTAPSSVLQYAIWFHDCIYDPKAAHGNNERLSAEHASKYLTRIGFPPERVSSVCHLVLCTVSHRLEDPSHPDLGLFLDLDIAILGEAPAVYDKYASQIRQEYCHYSDSDYNTGRSRVLRSFLSRKSVFQTDMCRERFEAQARANLQRELEHLSAA